MTAATVAVALAASGCTAAARVAAPAAPSPSASPAPAGSPVNPRLTLIGHEPLAARGMNAGLAIHGGYAYVGSRTDPAGGRSHSGIAIVDIADPAAPRLAGEIPLAADGLSTRELRVWHAESLLFVLSIPCTPSLHRCANATSPATITVYDVAGDAAAAPRLVTTWRPPRTPHEFFLWTDPAVPGRALLYLSTPRSAGGEVLVADVADARDGRIRAIASWDERFPDPGPDDAVHSLSVSADGTRAYLASLTAGFLVADTERVAAGGPMRTRTAPASRPQWPGPGAHSAVKVPGRPLVIATDEVYGAEQGGGCPFGWMRLIDVSDEVRPRVASQLKLPDYNDARACGRLPREHTRRVSYSTHNPTATRNLALVSWHAAGLVVAAIAEAARPQHLATFLPEPLPRVAIEDPVLTGGPVKVSMWSYPIIAGGLIYVVDVRNGLYVLRYEGPFAGEIAETAFAEGNSTGG